MDFVACDRLRRRLAEESLEQFDRVFRRIKVQLEFAEALAAQDGKETWIKLTNSAAAKVGEFEGNLSQLDELAEDVEALLEPIGKAAKENTIHCVGHGHIDMNWMWSWPETVAITHDTFASILSLMDKYPDFTYSQSQASVYALVEKYHPQMFEQIQRRVKEGRWEVTATHWVEGDKNIASGEALAHHLLYTRHYFRDKFGLSPEDCPLDWEPDTFGHANTIPGILAQGGVKYYYSCRTGGGHDHPRVGEERPPVFWWESPDGGRILVNRETTWYNSYVNIGENVALAALPFFRSTGLQDWLNIYGVGNHGGGPSYKEIEWLHELQSYPIYPTLKFSLAKTYFDTIAASGIEFPVIDHELNYEFTGCYTSQSAIKRANRFGEAFCVEAETLMALTETSAPNLRDAWLNVLFNQFHDILPGSGVAATREHAVSLFQETGAITGAIKREAFKKIALELDTFALLPESAEATQAREAPLNILFEAGVGQSAGQTGISQASGAGWKFHPVVIYNPCAWTRSELVEVDLWDSALEPGKIVARDENGDQYPTQVTYRSPGYWTDWQHIKTTVLFPAVDIPPLGYKTFLFCSGTPNVEVPQVTPLDYTRLETPDLILAFDRYGSGLSNVVDKRQSESPVLDGFGRWTKTHELPRGMTSWVIGGEPEPGQDLQPAHFHIGNLIQNEGTGAPRGTNFAYIVHQDLRVPGSKSKVSVKAYVQALSPRVDFVADIDWREIGDQESGIPGLAIDCDMVGFGETPVRFHTPFGSVLRAPSEPNVEVPSLSYAHVEGPNEGEGVAFSHTLVTDWVYGFSMDWAGPKMRVLRSSFDPDHAPEVGKSRLRYSIVFHDGPVGAADLTRIGEAQNHPLIPFAAPLQSGTRSTKASYAEVLSPNILLSTIKPAEDSDGIVLRLTEHEGSDTLAQVRLAPELLRGRASAMVVDFIERETGELAVVDGEVLRVRVQANRTVSVLIG
jgi:alpha-mannosidase